MKKRNLYILIIISVSLFFISLIGILGTVLDEKYMIYSGISDEEIGGLAHQKIKLRSYLFLLLGVVSFMGLGYSVFKFIK